jgi:hypothetical protein
VKIFRRTRDLFDQIVEESAPRPKPAPKTDPKGGK